MDGNAVGGIKSCVMKERRELAEDGLIVISVTLDTKGSLIAPLTIESRGVFLSEDRAEMADEIRAATDRVLKECSGGALKADAVSKGIKNRVRDIIRRRSSSYAVILPIVSIAGSNSDGADWLEKDFF